MTSILLRAVAALATLGCASLPAFADNLRSTFHVGNTSYLAAVFLPLSGAATTVSFSVPVAGIVSITFNAKCFVDGPSAQTYTDLDVLIDGIAVPPTNGAFDVFCGDYGGLTRTSLTVGKSLTAGNHTVRIRAATYNNAFQAFIGDSTLIVSR